MNRKKASNNENSSMKNSKTAQTKTNITLKGSSINLVERDVPSRSRTPSRPSSAMSKSKSHGFPWHRPASADFTLKEPIRTLCRTSSSLNVSPRKPESALSICQKAGFCGSDVLIQESKTGRQNGIHRKHSIHPDVEFIDPDLMKYAYTAESARLLQSLLREPWRSDDSGDSNPSSAGSRQTSKTSKSDHNCDITPLIDGRNAIYSSAQNIKPPCHTRGCYKSSYENNCHISSKTYQQSVVQNHQSYVQHPKNKTDVFLLEKHSNLDERSQFLRTSFRPQVPPPSPETYPDIVGDDSPAFSCDNDTIERGRKYVSYREMSDKAENAKKCPAKVAQNFKEKNLEKGGKEGPQKISRSPCQVLGFGDIETEIRHHNLENPTCSLLKTRLEIDVEKVIQPDGTVDQEDLSTRKSVASNGNTLNPSIENQFVNQLKDKSKSLENGVETSSPRATTMQFSDNFFVDNLDAPSKDSGRTESTLCLRDVIEEQKNIEKKNNAETDAKFQRLFHSSESDAPKTVRFQTNEENNDNKECVLIDLTDDFDKISMKSTTKKINSTKIAPEKYEKSCINEGVLRDSTLEDIENIINVLENEEPNTTERAVQTPEVPDCLSLTPKEGSKSQAIEIFQYLDQVERCSEPVNITRVVADSCEPSVPRMDELLCRGAVDLAREVLALRLQAEEQAGGIRLLQQTVAEVKETAKAERAAHNIELAKKASEGEAALLKQQKLTKQLLAEKKNLNEKLAEVINELKGSEERHQRNMKAQQERHLVELQRVKETHAAAEKLKREKWIDIKTQKIKEMTVKGLEPELSRMAARQQQEIQELRGLHRGELEALELKSARRNAELMDELRAELSRDKEEALQRESNSQRIKWEKRLEDETRIYEADVKRLKEDLRRERDRLNALENHVQEQLLEARKNSDREKERDRSSIIREWEEKLDKVQSQHQIELKNLKEVLELEKDVWMDNYKKIQAKKYLEKEADLHHQYKRERDRDIEIAIEKLETEAAKARSEMAEAAESKLFRLREKLTNEITELEAEVTTLKTKLGDVREQLANRDDQLMDVRAQLRQALGEHAQVTKLCEEMTAERSDLRKILQEEVEQQLSEAQNAVEVVKKEMAELRTYHAVELSKMEQTIQQLGADSERELQKVYSRVKITIKKKEEALELQREQYRVVLERCSHLENMLENQRKNLLL